MAHLKKKKLNNGEISYTIQSKAKDPLTGKYRYMCDTWHKPPSMTEYEARKENARRMFELDEKVKKSVLGILAQNGSTKLNDYIEDWLAKQQLANGDLYALNYESRVKPIKDYFKQVKMDEISPTMVQNFREHLLKHKIIHESAKMKEGKTLRLLLKSKKIKSKDISNYTNVSHGTYEAAHRGDNILYESAVKICNGLNVDFDEYFEKVTACKNYSKTTVSHIMGALSLILSEAKRQRIIEHNFASSEYITPLKREKTEIIVLDDEESVKLKKALDEEENMMRRTAIYLALFTGIRRGELCGIEWKDIDLNKGTLTISRAVREVPKVGLVTKGTKTKSSTRKITLSQILVDVLKEYREWYLERKDLFEEDWQHTDRLFISDEGRVLRPSCYIKWLRKILLKANIKKVTLHSLRHTNITLQLSSGVDLRTVSARAGHSRTSTTTDIYSHFLTSKDMYASQILNSVFEEKNEEKKIIITLGL